jgi:hypothetical protein
MFLWHFETTLAFPVSKCNKEKMAGAKILRDIY